MKRWITLTLCMLEFMHYELRSLPWEICSVGCYCCWLRVSASHAMSSVFVAALRKCLSRLFCVGMVKRICPWAFRSMVFYGYHWNDCGWLALTRPWDFGSSDTSYTAETAGFWCDSGSASFGEFGFYLNLAFWTEFCQTCGTQYPGFG